MKSLIPLFCSQGRPRQNCKVSNLPSMTSAVFHHAFGLDFMNQKLMHFCYAQGSQPSGA